MIIGKALLNCVAIGCYILTGIMYWERLKTYGRRDKYIIYVWPLVSVYIVVALMVESVWGLIKIAWTRLHKQRKEKQ